jgi:hypothetical protein
MNTQTPNSLKSLYAIAVAWFIALMLYRAQGATITGLVVNASGVAQSGATIKYTPVELKPNGSYIVSGSDVFARAVNGGFTNTLFSGDYLVAINGKQAFTIAVPDNSLTYDLATISVKPLTYVYGIGGSGGGTNGVTMIDDLLDVNTTGQATGKSLIYTNSVWYPMTVPVVWQLDDLPDVNTNSAANGYALRYTNATWRPMPDVGVALDDLTDVATTGAENGYAVRYTNGTYRLLPDVTVSMSLDALTDVATAGAANGYAVRYTNGSWVPLPDPPSTGSGIPGGSTTQVQINSAGAFGGAAGLTYNSSTLETAAANLTVSTNFEAQSASFTDLSVEFLTLDNPVPVSAGGTGASSMAAGSLIGGNGSSALTPVTVGSGLALVGGTLSATGGGGSSTPSVKVETVTVTDPNLNATTPAAPAGSRNVTFSASGSSISASIGEVTSSLPGLMPATTASKWVKTGADGGIEFDDLPASGSDNGIPKPFTTAYAKHKVAGRMMPGGASSTSIMGYGMYYATPTGTGASLAPTATAPRGVSFTSTASTDAEAGPYANSPHIWAGRDLTMWALVGLGDSADHNRVWVCFTDTATVMASNTPDDTIGFRFSTAASDAGWVAYSRNQATTYANPTGVSVTTGTVYLLVVVKTDAGATFYINGAQVGTTTTVPTAATDLLPYCKSRTTTSTATVFNFYDFGFEQPIP